MCVCRGGEGGSDRGRGGAVTSAPRARRRCGRGARESWRRGEAGAGRDWVRGERAAEGRGGARKRDPPTAGRLSAQSPP